MNIDDRIERRLGYDAGAGVLITLDAVSPVAHLDSPIGRGPALERLLDVFNPALSGQLPPSTYVFGPKGSGKSAVVSALFARLATYSGPPQAIQTTTRAVEPTLPGFVYVDARRAGTRFRLYHDTLAAVTDESVPDHGVGTDDLAASLRSAVDDGTAVVVAVDHTNEPETPAPATVVEWLTDVSGRIVPVCLGRDQPDALAWDPDASVAFTRYRRHVLVELLTSRCSTGLGRDAISTIRSVKSQSGRQATHTTHSRRSRARPSRRRGAGRRLSDRPTSTRASRESPSRVLHSAESSVSLRAGSGCSTSSSRCRSRTAPR